MEELIRAGVALIAIANPIGAVPVYLDLTDGVGRDGRKRAGFLVGMAVFGILVSARLNAMNVRFKSRRHRKRWFIVPVPIGPSDATTTMLKWRKSF